MSPLHSYPLAVVFTGGRADRHSTPRRLSDHRTAGGGGPRRRPKRVALAAGATVALFATLAAACGSDDADGPATAACDAAVDYGAAFASGPQDPAEIPAFAKERMLPIAEALEGGLEGDALAAATALREAIATVADGGDMGVLETPEVVEARATIGAAIHDGCDLQQVSVSAIDWAFTGIPDELPSGRISFAVDYEGKDEHEMVVFRRNDDSTSTLDEILELPGEEMMSQVTMTGVTYGSPGTTSYLTADLEPGTYFLLCFLPQHGEEDGMPHFMAGMRHTLVIA